MRKVEVKGPTHRFSPRHCKHCDAPMTVQTKRNRGRGVGLCIACMRDPKVYPRCKGVNNAGKACKSIALYRYDEETNSGFCTYHKGD